MLELESKIVTITLVREDWRNYVKLSKEDRADVHVIKAAMYSYIQSGDANDDRRRSVLMDRICDDYYRIEKESILQSTPGYDLPILDKLYDRYKELYINDLDCYSLLGQILILHYSNRKSYKLSYTEIADIATILFKNHAYRVISDLLYSGINIIKYLIINDVSHKLLGAVRRDMFDGILCEYEKHVLSRHDCPQSNLEVYISLRTCYIKQAGKCEPILTPELFINNPYLLTRIDAYILSNHFYKDEILNIICNIDYRKDLNILFNNSILSNIFTRCHNIDDVKKVLETYKAAIIWHYDNNKHKLVRMLIKNKRFIMKIRAYLFHNYYHYNTVQDVLVMPFLSYIDSESRCRLLLNGLFSEYSILYTNMCNTYMNEIISYVTKYTISNAMQDNLKLILKNNLTNAIRRNPMFIEILDYLVDGPSELYDLVRHDYRILSLKSIKPSMIATLPYELLYSIVEKHSSYLKYIPDSCQTVEMQMLSVKRNPQNIYNIENPRDEVFDYVRNVLMK